MKRFAIFFINFLFWFILFIIIVWYFSESSPIFNFISWTNSEISKQLFTHLLPEFFWKFINDIFQLKSYTFDPTVQKDLKDISWSIISRFFVSCLSLRRQRSPCNLFFKVGILLFFYFWRKFFQFGFHLFIIEEASSNSDSKIFMDTCKIAEDSLRRFLGHISSAEQIMGMLRIFWFLPKNSCL